MQCALGDSLGNVQVFELASGRTTTLAMKVSPPVVRFPFCAFLASIRNDVGIPDAPSGRRPGPTARQQGANEFAKNWNEHEDEVRSFAPILTRTSHTFGPVRPVSMADSVHIIYHFCSGEHCS